jgi:release factor glutamine methyltransferase
LTETILIDELEFELHDQVYIPSEDTFQLLEALDITKKDRVLEIGTGCGIIALICAKKGASVVCSDINPFAVECTAKNYEKNQKSIKGFFEIRLGDLFSVIDSNEKFDLIIFNPPYLPTKKEDKLGGSGWFDVATDGGIDGLKITKEFVKGVRKYLKKNARAYFILSSLSNKAKFDNFLNKNKINFEVINCINYDDENLYVYKILKN